jgi:hypothetical protein
MATVAAWLYGVKRPAAEILWGCDGTCERIDVYPIISPNTFVLTKETGMATTVHIIEFSDYL